LSLPTAFLGASSLLRIEDAKGATALELVVRLVRGCDGDLEIMGELSLAPLPGAFGDVVTDGVNRAEKLRPVTFPRGATLPSAHCRLPSAVCCLLSSVHCRLPSRWIDLR
jgi:hypothetical protein